MNKIKRLLTTTLMIFVVSFLAKASNEPTTLYVKLKTGDIKAFLLSEKPTVTFDSENIYINSSEFSTEYSNVEEFNFMDKVTDINKVFSEKTQSLFGFKFIDGKIVTITGCKKSDRLAVYSVNGMKVSTDAERADDSIVIDLGNMPSGIYIINVNSQSFKIYKK